MGAYTTLLLRLFNAVVDDDLPLALALDDTLVDVLKCPMLFFYAYSCLLLSFPSMSPCNTSGSIPTT